MIRAIAFTLVLSFVSLASAQDTYVPLSSLDLSKMTAGWGEPQADKNCMGQPMSIAGRTFEHGVGTHADSLMHVELDGKASRFTALVGVDGRTGERGTISFQVYADGKKAFDSGPMKGGDPAKQVDVPLEGVRHLTLMVGSGGDDVSYDNANWVEAEFVCRGAKPVAVDAPTFDEEKVILTPKPGPEPRINGPRLFGARPGHPFIYRIPCTGNRPMVFGVENLPDGLSLDQNTGIITGRVPEQPAEYGVTLTACNDAGTAKKKFTLVVGEGLALTPPMGWNSWYIHYHRVTGKVMREAADVMVSSGMADYGYTYVNIDDCWMRIEPQYFEEVKGRLTGFDMTGVIGKIRDENGNILPNDNFADMAAMTDYIHSKGLRAGTYISPGPRTCQRYAGSYEHERQDAEQFAKWGFDFLKYDWCSYSQVYNDKHTKQEGIEEQNILFSQAWTLKAAMSVLREHTERTIPSRLRRGEKPLPEKSQQFTVDS